MAASLDDILTVQKNGVIAINGLNQTLRTIYPATTSPTIAASTTQLVVAGSGRIFAVSIPVHAGSAQVYIYNSATTGGISASNLIFASLPSNASSFTPYQNVNLAYTNGIVLKTDAGMNFCVAYTAN